MNLAELLQKKYEISPTRGCLPPDDPEAIFYFQRPQSACIRIEDIGENLPAILRSGTLASEIKRIPILDETFINGRLQTRSARLLMVRLAFIAHAYVWERWQDGIVQKSLPPNLAIPLLVLGKRFGFAPLLNYWNYALWNWKRKWQGCAMAPENLKLIQNFLGGESEEWFVTIHVAIEHAVAPLFIAGWELGDALEAKNRAAILGCLGIIASGLRDMNALMRRMPDHCDTEVYFKSVRPYLYGWNVKHIFPNDMCYEGRTPEENIFLDSPGETGAQSLIVPCLDRIFGISHESGQLSGHLYDMLHTCALEKQRNFVLEFERRTGLSAVAGASYGSGVEEAYWECRKLLAKFRAVHFYYAAEYIQKQARAVEHPFDDKASGGSPYVASLWKHFEETLGEHMAKEMGGTKEAFNTLIYPFVL